MGKTVSFNAWSNFDSMLLSEDLISKLMQLYFKLSL